MIWFVLSLIGICKVYGEGEVEVHVFNGVDFEVQCGDYVVIMGVFGLGKSMMMNIIGCLDVFIYGCYVFDGFDVCWLDEYQ